jgi:hypothetical protein
MADLTLLSRREREGGAKGRKGEGGPKPNAIERPSGTPGTNSLRLFSRRSTA